MERFGQLSVFIITKNEEERLGKVLSNLPNWVKEVIVVDSGSTDQTCEIAKNFGAKVFFNSWKGYGQQKRYAEEKCRTDWVLNLDADEVLDNTCLKNLSDLFQVKSNSNLLIDDYDGFRLQINTVYAGEKAPRPFAKDYNPVRLYRRSSGQYRDHPVYDRVVFQCANPRIGQLQGQAFHYTFTSWRGLCEKAESLIRSNAKNDKIERIKALLIVRFIFSLPVEFFRFFVLRGHILGGFKGFLFSAIWAWYRTKRIWLLALAD